MTPDKQRRVATAVGFLSGLLACMQALRDQKILWPPDDVWMALTGPQKFMVGGGIALIVVTMITTLVVSRGTARR